MKTFCRRRRKRGEAPRAAAATNLRRKFLPLASIVLFVILLLPGCESKDPAYPPAPTAGLLNIRNESSHVFGMLQFRMHGTDLWSRNYLSGPIDLYSEHNYYFPVGDVDFRFEAADGSVTWTYERTIDENDTAYIILSD